MTRLMLILTVVLPLAGCGVDGAPTPPRDTPTNSSPKPGLSITGDARVGVTANL